MFNSRKMFRKGDFVEGAENGAHPFNSMIRDIDGEDCFHIEWYTNFRGDTCIILDDPQFYGDSMDFIEATLIENLPTPPPSTAQTSEG